MKRASISGRLAVLGLLGCLAASAGCENQVAEQLPGGTAVAPETKNGPDLAPAEKPVQPDAELVLQRSLATAKKLDKKVFVHIGAPW